MLFAELYHSTVGYLELEPAVYLLRLLERVLITRYGAQSGQHATKVAAHA